MIDCIFTIDYEIYGNGAGSLLDHVYDPTRRLMDVFLSYNAKFVSFVEVAEFERIAEEKTDAGIGDVEKQIREIHQAGFEVALHLHPQWYNARFEKGRWELDFSQYNLCTLPRDQIERIIQRALEYLRRILREPGFVPLSFRAGNWLLQPTKTAAAILAESGIKIDSSVFKGGLQHRFGLDYRPALRNGYFWRFQDDANRPDTSGGLLEIPTYTRMVPAWRMVTRKRLGLQQKSPSTANRRRDRLNRLRDYLRFRYPLKFDFCRMTMDELRVMLDELVQTDSQDPSSYKPIVAIGHTKDLVDFETVDSLLSLLKARGIRVATFQQAHQLCERVLNGNARTLECTSA